MIHHVFANRSNVGDWLSAIGIQALLAPRPVVEHLCDEPFVPDTLRALAAASPSDVVVIGGGGLLMDYFTPFWRGLAQLPARPRLCVWGVGYVDLKQEASRGPADLLRRVLGRARVCRVRDDLTREHLAPLALPPAVPCPSLVAVAPAPPSSERRLLHAASTTTVGDAVYERMRSHGEAFARATGRVFSETNNRIEADDRGALDRVVDLYRRSDAVLAARLHACLIAVALGRPVLAVSGDRKIEAFMASAGLSDWVLDLDETEALPERLAALETQPRVTGFVADAIERNRAVAREVAAVIAEAP